MLKEARPTCLNLKVLFGLFLLTLTTSQPLKSEGDSTMETTTSAWRESWRPALKEAFDEFDWNKDGVINQIDVEIFYEQVRNEPTAEVSKNVLEDMILRMDFDHDGNVTFDEYFEDEMKWRKEENFVNEKENEEDDGYVYEVYEDEDNGYENEVYEDYGEEKEVNEDEDYGYENEVDEEEENVEKVLATNEGEGAESEGNEVDEQMVVEKKLGLNFGKVRKRERRGVKKE